MPEVKKLGKLQGAELNCAKQTLALEVTKIVHGEQAAQQAQAAAYSAFGQGPEGAEGIPTTCLSRERLNAGLLVVDVLAEVGLCKSKSEARRLVSQNGACLGDKRVSGIEETISEGDFQEGCVLLRAGKKKVHRLQVKKND
jgi:tyrosyl-tRNA synthetase